MTIFKGLGIKIILNHIINFKTSSYSLNFKMYAIHSNFQLLYFQKQTVSFNSVCFTLYNNRPLTPRGFLFVGSSSLSVLCTNLASSHPFEMSIGNLQALCCSLCSFLTTRARYLQDAFRKFNILVPMNSKMATIYL